METGKSFCLSSLFHHQQSYTLIRDSHLVRMIVSQATELGLKYTVRTDRLINLWPTSWLKLRASWLTETGAHTHS